MSDVIPFDKPREIEPRCSFCDLPKSDVKKLISNAFDTYHVCDKCVAKCSELLK